MTNYKNQCSDCKYKKNIPGNTHIRCDNPDPNIKGNDHAIKNGWFMYPFNFDPIWMLNECINYESKIKRD